jgi:hypothetical protein
VVIWMFGSDLGGGMEREMGRSVRPKWGNEGEM